MDKSYFDKHGLIWLRVGLPLHCDRAADWSDTYFPEGEDGKNGHPLSEQVTLRRYPVNIPRYRVIMTY